MAGLYVHIPFCHSKCAYCDFYSMPNMAKSGRLVDALINEYDMRQAEVTEDITTIYIGGGTPSVLDRSLLTRLVGALPVSDHIKEFTIEVNPEDVDREFVVFIKSLGINRVSMGVQSFVDTELRAIGRRHSAMRALEAVDALREGGIDNFSIDLIYGLPGQTPDSWRYSLERLFSISPTHFSAYILSYEPRTRLTAMLKKGLVTEADDELVAQMYQMLTEQARDNGYEHYEISNFAKPGFRAVHNTAYWQSVPYIGIGPSAHSYDGNARRVNPSDLNRYLEALESGALACEIEEETATDRYNDLVLTALRTSDGLDVNRVRIPRRRRLLCDAFAYIKSGRLEVDGPVLRISEPAWLVSDAILRDLMQ